MRTSRTLTYGHLLTTTREKYHKAGILTNIFSESNPLLMTLKENSWKVQTKGGEMIRVNLMTSANTTGTAYTGYEDLNVAPQDGMTIAYFPWTHYSWALSMSGPEQFKNSGEAQIVSDLREKEKQLIASASEDIDSDLLDATNTSASTGRSGKAIQSLPNLIHKDPTASATVGGIQQSTESKWRNRTQDGGTWSTGQLWQTGFTNMLNRVNRGPGKACDMVLADQVTYELTEQALRDNIRYQSTKTAEMGFGDIALKPGVNMFWDVYVPNMEAGTNGGPDTTISAGTAFFLNSQCLKFYCGEGYDFKPLPFERLGAQDATTSLTLLYAQLVTDNRRKLGVIWGLPTSIT